MKKNPPTETPTPDALPLGPYVIHNDDRTVTATPAGIEAIFILAKNGSFQETIAANFSITKKQFTVMIGDGLNASPARLAYEGGKALDKQQLIDKVRTKALAGDMNAAMYLGRAVHQLYDKSTAAISVENKIGFQFLPPEMSSDEMQRNMKAAAAGGILLVPTGMSEEEYIKIHGPVIDSRSTKNIVAMMQAIDKPTAEIDTYLASIGRSRMRPDECGTMIDVSPERPAQIAPPTPTPSRSIGPGYSTSDPNKVLR